MIATDQTLENLTLTINQEIHVQAPMDATFAALLEQLGRQDAQHEDRTMARWQVVPRPGRRQWAFLGACPGHQAAYAA